MATRPESYGFTAEVKQKQNAKYDANLEREAKDWLASVAGEPFPSGSFHDSLKDGVFLCKVINNLRPGSVKKINTGKMAFKMMENIGNFLDAADKYGLPKSDSFQTVDLYEAENMVQVVNSIHALGRVAKKKGFSGKGLGPKEAQKNVRSHDPQQQKAMASSVIGLQMGTNKGASQAGMTPYGQQRQIHDSKR